MKAYPIVSRAARIATALVVVAALLPGRARAQVASGANTTINTTSAGYLGILKLRCDCTLRVDSDDRFRFFSFRSDPIVGSIERGSPADGVLSIGDYITHVDGLAIRTSAGGQRFARIQPGENVELTIWRRGRSSKVRLRASGVDWDDYRVLGTVAPEAVEGDFMPPRAPVPGLPSRTPRVPRTPRPAEAPRAPAESRIWADVTPGVPQIPAEPTIPPEPSIPAQPAIPPEPAVPAIPATPPGFSSAWSVMVPGRPTSPAGWFGFSFRCSDCGWSSGGREGENPVWESGDSPPELSMISRGGPADRAGLRAGDKLTHIDGLSITSREGARRLGAVKPGQRVRVTVIRDGKSLTRPLTLGTRPEARATVSPRAQRAPGPPAPPRVRSELRYTGKLDDVSVEVWSHSGSNVERIGNTMVITVGTSVIRLKVDPKK